jgi:plasmid stabilization system protein ParE
MTYRVVVLRRAEEQVAAIIEWISQASLSGAERWTDAFEAALERLAADPLRFGGAPEAEALGRDLRQILFRTRHGHVYRAVFVIDADEVRVLYVRAPGQDSLKPQDL